MKKDMSRRGILGILIGAAAIPARAGEPAASPQPAPDAPLPAAPALPPAASDGLDISLTLNGEPIAARVDPDQSALSLIRDRGLRGSKEGCGHGACGACAVEVAGSCVAACLLPATTLHRMTVRTVEGISPPAGPLHPVQRAFLAEDALQCGYCTPGFIVESTVFYERWRAENGAENGAADPGDEAVAAALAGHICRCGAYTAILRAVRAACRGEHEQEGQTAQTARVEGREKVTGQARYTADIALPLQLEGRVLRSPVASGRLLRLDLEPARKIPGVQAAISLMAGSKIRYHGQEIAAVAATSARIAEEALRAIRLEIAEAPAVSSMEQALAPGAALLYEEDRGAAPNANEGPLMGAPWAGNRRGPFRTDALLKPGAARKILAEMAAGAGSAGAKVEGTFETQMQSHSAMEPHGCVASFETDRLVVYLSTQDISGSARDIAERFGLKEEQVQVKALHIGGGFGSKAILAPEVFAAVGLAQAAGRPVRVVLSRREELQVGGYRSGSRVEVALAAKPDGDPAALSVKAHSLSGVAVGALVGAIFRVMYPYAEKSIEDNDVLTHAAPGKPFRAPGGPPAFFALEQAMDMLALTRNEDPLALRRRWDPSPIRQELYAMVAADPRWKDRRAGPDTGRFRRGIGLASGGWIVFTQADAQLQLESRPDGRLIASAPVQDMGNGTRTTIYEAIRQYMDLPDGALEVRIGETMPINGLMSAGSRTTSSLLPAAEDACAQLMEELRDRVAADQRLAGAAATRAGIAYEGGVIPWIDAVRAAPKTVVLGRRRPDQGGYVVPVGYDGIRIGVGISGAVQLTEVEVDTRLGKIRPLHVWAGYGVGRVLSPALAANQARGGVLQSLGYALYEERVADPRRGLLMSHNLEDYRVPGIGDTPTIDVHFLPGHFDHVRGGAVGIGELVTTPGAASLANAVHHATGWRPMQLPIRPDRLLAGLSALPVLPAGSRP